MTPSGIEPATFQFVAQHLKHCATAAPNVNDLQDKSGPKRKCSIVVVLSDLQPITKTYNSRVSKNFNKVSSVESIRGAGRNAVTGR
jgi:hypothetical protein